MFSSCGVLSIHGMHIASQSRVAIGLQRIEKDALGGAT